MNVILVQPNREFRGRIRVMMPLLGGILDIEMVMVLLLPLDGLY